MKEYVIIVVVSVGIFFLLKALDKYKTPKYRFISSIIGITGFSALLIGKIITEKTSGDDLVSLLLFSSLIIYLAGQAFKNYKDLKSQ